MDANYDEVYLFPRAVEEWVEADHPARFIREVVESLDGEELGLCEDWGQPRGRGRPHYAPRLLLKAWLYGYLNGVDSSRKLERACREHLSLIWLLGCHAPDHNTLWRFWNGYREALRGVFVQVVRIAAKAGAAGAVLHALDGTKIQSEASSRRGATGTLQEWEGRLVDLEAAIDGIEAEIARQGSGERGEGYRLPKELARKRKLRERVREAVREVRESQAQESGAEPKATPKTKTKTKTKPESKSGSKSKPGSKPESKSGSKSGSKAQTEPGPEPESRRFNPFDPQARTMPCGDVKRLAYNAQAVVDEGGLIVAEGVTDEETDCNQVEPMLERVEEVLGATARDTVADKGYRTDENIGESARNKRSVLLQMYDNELEGAAPFHKSRFEYDAEKDLCICPLGRKLHFEGVRKSRHGWIERRYRCGQSAECPVAAQCCSDKRGRAVHIGPYEGEVRAQRERQMQPEGKEKLARRKPVVEPVFAQLKHNRGFRRWSFRGLENVQTQWSMLCTAYNLRKLLRLWADGKLSLRPAPCAA